jgi:hypothetical protein
MIQKINKQIGVINSALTWIKKNKPEHYEQRFMQLVEERRKLRKLAIAEAENPAIAAFGESQKGKSYLMGNLLQKNGVPYMVKINDGMDEVNFVQSVNPIGDNKEATGVVTRFTTFKGREGRYNAKLPVIVKLLSPASIATILSGGYFKNIMDYQTYSDQEINTFSQAILDKYKFMPDSGQTAFVEDDVLEIKHYLGKFVTEAQGLLRSTYFENLALVARKIPVSEWTSVLEYLWHQNSIVSGMFNRMINLLQKLNFANEIYTDIETVRHYGDNTNTIMSVDCLNGLDNSAWNKTADVYVKEGSTLTLVPGVSKCELAAVCAETIYKVEREYVEDMMDYKYYEGDTPGDLPHETLRKLHATSIKKELLNSSDLLDFPGARNYLKLQEKFLDKKDDNGASNAVQMLLRGKVTYLFNDYSESRIINILLFCHDAADPVVNEMYIMVNDWVEKYVGRTANERQQTIQKCGGIPPLFNICTKFNMDMVEDEHEEKNNDNALNQRWFGRLNKALYTKAFKANDVDWFKNWNGPGVTFKNSFLLRDFKYSSCNGTGNNLFDGYKDTDVTPNETKMKLTPDFYRRLRTTFITNPHVQMFFNDPVMAWDLAATRNNDGALYIIDNLTIVAKNMSMARDSQFLQQVEESRSKLSSLLGEYHVSEDTDEILQENIRKANSIIREMDFTCNEDNYFFGHLLQALQITETRCLQEVHQMIQSGDLGERNTNFTDYEIILKRCRDFKGCNGFDECWQRLQQVYGFRTQEEAAKFLENRSVDYHLLFSKSFKKKLNSCVLADHVYGLWKKNIKSAEFMNMILDNQRFDSVVMSTLLDDITLSSEYIKLNDIMSDAIAEFVNVINIYTINESLVADILSSTINSFVIDLGYQLLPDDDKENAHKVTSMYQLPIYDYIEHEHTSRFEEDELTELFNDLTDNPKAMTVSFENNYYSWLEYMYVSFIAHIAVPEYDKEANRQLTEIINSI